MSISTQPPTPDPLTRAQEILAIRGPQLPFSELKQLVKALKKAFEFRLARSLLRHCQTAYPDRCQVVWIIQQQALCTYKDETKLPAKRFGEALALLESVGLRDPQKAGLPEVQAQTLSETLALGGAVYKRMFEYDGQLENLHCALALYRAAWNYAPRLDLGYGGVNAAFVLDLLASRLAAVATRTGTALEEIDRLRREARALREAMAGELTAAAQADPTLAEQYWFVVTQAEVQFGLRNYAAAGEWLARARGQAADEWERQTTFRQLVMLARLQGYAPPAPAIPPSAWADPWKALAQFLGDGARNAFACWRGKVGLALSGGGFRASFFHLGVLARLAEMDVLPSLEALSTVSGGSIVGAHYYLELQRLIESKPDGEITRADFVALVQRVQQQFFRGVQKNLRTRVLTNLPCALKMVVPGVFGLPTYSRSHRIGELYEQELYAPGEVGRPPGSVRTMPSLLIKPAGEREPEKFRPNFSNWRRAAKVPVLLLNTTSLNSGHNWQFTARSLGEPPGLVQEGIDATVRYRRLNYEEAPSNELKNYPLGYAVAGSACVPGLFDPLVIQGLYPGRTVRLVDGGVHDNQGVAGLLDEACTFILCSDASGQMEDSATPSDGLLGVPLRMNAILMDRVREAQHQDLDSRVENRALHGLFFIHMKQDLSSTTLDWVDCAEPREERPRLTTTSYGVDRDLQRKLAGIRTDLDSFTEVEAQALMLSGYLMTEQQFKALDQEYRQAGNPGSWGGFDIEAPRGDWDFLRLEAIVGKPPDSADLRRQDLGRQLDVGAEAAFKAWHLVRGLRLTAYGLLAAIVAGAGWLIYRFWDHGISLGSISVGQIILAALLLAGGAVFPLLKFLQPQKAMRGFLLQVVAATLGWAVANLHLRFFDPVFLKRGEVARLLRLKPD